MAELQIDGHSNFGFQADDDCNCDTVSRYTATTEVADDRDSVVDVVKSVDVDKMRKPKKRKMEKVGTQKEEAKTGPQTDEG